VLSWRQARWAEILSTYNFVIKHLKGNKNPQHEPSRRPDHDIGYEHRMAKLLAT
jgi:hypothetical protein